MKIPFLGLVLCLLLASLRVRNCKAACWRDEEGTKWCDVRTRWRSTGEKGIIRYAEQCAFDFGGKYGLNNKPPVSIPAEFSSLSAGILCGTLCLKEEECTHFTVSNGATCVLKSRVRPVAIEPNRRMGMACGYITTRTDFALPVRNATAIRDLS